MDTDDEHRGGGRAGEYRSVDFRDRAISEQSECEFHARIDVNFAMSGQRANLRRTDLGAPIELEASNGDGGKGESNAFANRKRGGEEIFIHGEFGALAMREPTAPWTGH